MFEHDYKNFPELTNQQLEVLQFTSPHKQITEDFDAVVVKVHDGDTLTLRADFRDFDFPCRLVDIDAPELNEGGQKAKEWLEQKLLLKKVKVLINSKKRVGKYGRLLGSIMLNGLEVSEEMLQLGLVKKFDDRNEEKLPNINKIMQEVKI